MLKRNVSRIYFGRCTNWTLWNTCQPFRTSASGNQTLSLPLEFSFFPPPFPWHETHAACYTTHTGWRRQRGKKAQNNKQQVVQKTTACWQYVQPRPKAPSSAEQSELSQNNKLAPLLQAECHIFSKGIEGPDTAGLGGLWIHLREQLRRLFHSVMKEPLATFPDIPFLTWPSTAGTGRLPARGAQRRLDKLIHQRSMFKSPSNAGAAP